MTDTRAAERFFDDYARIYDAVYAGHEFDDVGFYVDRAIHADGPVLEVACGTGRVYLELLRAGIDADGFDVSSGMLEELKRKAEAAGLAPTVWQADMTEVEPAREYGLVIVPFRSFLHNLTVADQIAALKRFKEALRPGGELVLNAFAPDFDVICGEYGEVRESYLRMGDRTYREERVSRLDDEVNQVVSVQWLFEAVEPGATSDPRDVDIDGPSDPPELLVNEFQIALVSKPQFELLFRTAGYDEWAVHGGFDLEPLESTDQEMVWIARPQPESAPEA